MQELKTKIYDETNGISYTLVGDYYVPDIELAEDDDRPVGKWGRMHQAYARWCEDNLEKPLAAKTFLHYVREHQKEIGIVYDDKCIGNSRGFRNISLMPFVPVDEDDPDLPWH